MNSVQSVFSYTEFQDVFGMELTVKRTRWPDFVEVVRNPLRHKNKRSMPLVKLATFGQKRSDHESLRHDENMLQISGIEGDYDAAVVGIETAAARNISAGLVPIETAAELLRAAGIEAVLYTTARHTVELPRWRVMCPLAKPCSPDQRASLVAVLNGALGGILAVESFSDSLSYFFGAVEGKAYESVHVSGNCIDDGPDLFITPIAEDMAVSGKVYTSHDPDDLPETVPLDAVSDIKLAVAALDGERADDYNDWVAVLQHLRHLAWCGHAEIAESIAREFSARSSKFNASKFSKKWDSLPLSKGHYKTIFVLAERDGWINPRKGVMGDIKDLTDSGNTAVLVEIADGDLRHVTEQNAFMHWCDHKWVIDTANSHATRLAQSVAATYKEKAIQYDRDAENATTPVDKKRLQKLADTYRSWAAYCRSKRGIDAMLELSKRHSNVVISQSQLDSNPYLFGVKNGVVDLRTGLLLNESRDDFVTKRSQYAYHSDATAPTFENFITEIFSEPVEVAKTEPIRYLPRADIEQYVQKAFGYAMTGNTSEHKFFIASGSGANGKSILFDTITQTMGDYAGTIPSESLMATVRSDDAERPTPFARSLAGKRLVVTTEAKEGQRLNAALVKRQTGDSKLVARGMRENAFTFDVTHKIFLLTNHIPEFDHSDDATRGRVHAWAFLRTWNRPGITNRNPRLPDGDKHLMEKLRVESEGVLAWLVRGAVAYLCDGLDPPPAVTESTNEYLLDQDSFGRWLADMQPCEPRDGMSATAMWDSFNAWCASQGATVSPSTFTTFGKTASARGVAKGRGAGAIMYGLRDNARDIF